ncbi:MAG TPA: hypothetical protein VJX74_08345 [Blastocatellia bacterium]|nr:hypothetical protein [Blastocatellia bacterium]
MVIIYFVNPVTIPGGVAIAILAAIAVFVFFLLWGKAKEGTIYYKIMIAVTMLLAWSGFFGIIKAIWPVD